MHTAAKICLAFCLGLFVATIFGNSIPFFAAGLFAVIALFTYFFRNCLPVKRIYLFSLIVAIGAAYFSTYLALTVTQTEQFEGQTTVVTGSVREMKQRDGGYTYTVKADNIGGNDFVVPVLVNLYVDEPLDADYGDTLTAKVEVYSVEDPTVISLWGSSAAKGIDLTGRVVSAVKVTPGRTTFSGLCMNLRDNLCNSLSINLPSPESAVMEGILFGKKDQIPYSIMRDFNHSGIAHVLAVSGLHISIITALLLGFFALLKIPLRVGRLLALAFLAIFCAMAGFTPSVVRACLMAAILAVGEIYHRHINRLDTLGVAAMIILIISPYCIVNLSFLLSFFSVLGILLFATPLTKKLYGNRQGRGMKFILGSISVSLSAMVFTVPIIALSFGCFSVVSPIVNLFIVPLMEPLILFGLLTAVIGLFFPSVALFLGFVTEQLCSLLEAIAKFFSDLPFAILPAGYDYVPALIFACLVLFALPLIFCRKPKVLGVTGLLCLNMILATAFSYQLFSANQMEITVLENLYQSPILIQCCGKTVLLNCTNKYGAETVCSYMDGHGIKKIDLMLFVGMDSPSMVGTQLLLDEVPVEMIAVPSGSSFDTFSYLGEKAGVPVVAADTISWVVDSITIIEKKEASSDVLLLSCDGFVVGYSNNSSSLAIASHTVPLNIALLDAEKAPSREQIITDELFWLHEDSSITESNVELLSTKRTNRIVTDGNKITVRKGGIIE